MCPTQRGWGWPADLGVAAILTLLRAVRLELEAATVGVMGAGACRLGWAVPVGRAQGHHGGRDGPVDRLGGGGRAWRVDSAGRSGGRLAEGAVRRWRA